ncbi:carbonic anhydrase [Roseateles violae]|uniref:carbonic anhydrase n=1 Tax=Roseateles violae TaxID=3058042 RepID=A0ABT8DVP3_9BURK|nr:carbonic anhydrase family protein [Pelomonas sp. PFR6]MDN3922282.1 carbonic anhydrase family protein [Pelomonas sp. PFR6]
MSKFPFRRAGAAAVVSCALLALSPAAAAAADEEPLELLRQRLAEQLSKPEAKPAAKPGKAAPARPAASSAAHSSAHPAAYSGALEPRPEPRPEPAAHGAAAAHWGYAGEAGPEHWAGLSADNRLCASGTRQSPIDIREGIKVELEKIRFDYRPSGFSVLDNGHTVQVDLAPGNALQVMGRRYELQQFHFHRPSEERVNGRAYEMVAHLVHQDGQGRLAVVAVLLERGADGRPHPLVQTVWNNLPLEKGEALPGPGQLDPLQLLPAERGYYTYMGSLTTPPCSEGVLWMVMRQPVALSAQQIAIFAKLYPMNARPVQAGAGRLIKESQ